MKYQSSITKIIYDLHFDSGVKKRYQCPECSDSRKKVKAKDLEYYPDTNRAFCFHCQITLFEYKPYVKKEYVLPEWKNITNLSDKAVKWFNSRMISQVTLNKMKVYSDEEYMPQFGKQIEVVCFPYFLDDKLINIKYRGPQKSFKLHSGSELVFWNIDCLKKANECIVCEGEIDALTYIEVGYENVMSVPNGAGNNLEYLNDYIDFFKPIRRILISVDNDTKGIELRDELIRRLGVEKCLLINLRECKDANEFLTTYSGNELKDAIKYANQIPIKGIVRADNIYNDLVDMFENGIKPGLEIGVYEIDKYILWETGKLVVCTGEPGMGKSECVDYIVSRLNLLYGWKVAIFSPENYPLKYHYSKIYEKLIGKQFKKTDTGSVEFDMAFDYINSNYFYILNEDDLTLKNILDSAKYLVSKEGIKILIIDPYNKVDHQYEKGQNETQYVSKFLDALTNFAKFYDVLVFLIAHPAKLKPGEIPNLYTISGSANFYNKCDYGFTFLRMKDENNVMTNESQIHWQKFRFKHLGKHGISNLVYNWNNGRFEQLSGSDVKNWDNSNWLVSRGISQIKNDNFYEPIDRDETVPF
jgi:twinkle protein